MKGYAKYWIGLAVIIVLIAGYFFFLNMKWDVSVYFWILGALIVLGLIAIAIFYWNKDNNNKIKSEKSEVLGVSGFTEFVEKDVKFFENMVLVKPFELQLKKLRQSDGKVTTIYFSILTNALTKVRYFCATDNADRITNTIWGKYTTHENLMELIEGMNQRPQTPQKISKEVDLLGQSARYMVEGFSNPIEKKDDEDVMKS